MWYIFNSLRSICCEECNSLYIPPNLNETSAMARYAPTQYFSDTYCLLPYLFSLMCLVSNLAI